MTNTIRLKTLFFALLMMAGISHLSLAQGRKIYPGQTKTRSNTSMPISRKVAYRFTYLLGVGRTTYYGQLYDLDRDGVFKFPGINPQINAGFRYRLNNRFSVAATYRYFRVCASDATSDPNNEYGRGSRNLSFRTTGHEFGVTGRFDLIPAITRFIGEKAAQYNRRNPTIPYVTATAGLLYFIPKAELDGKYVDLTDYKTSDKSGYSQITGYINAGPGVQLKVAEFFDVYAEILVTKTFTDALDDVIGGSKFPENNLDPGFANTTDGRLADRHTDSDGNGDTFDNRRDPNGSYPYRGGTKTGRTDWYYLFNVGVSYTLSSPLKFKQPKHKHFQKGKGVKNHKFKVR